MAREGVSRAFKEAGLEVCGDSRNIGTQNARIIRARIVYEDNKTLL